MNANVRHRAHIVESDIIVVVLDGVRGSVQWRLTVKLVNGFIHSEGIFSLSSFCTCPDLTLCQNHISVLISLICFGGQNRLWIVGVVGLIRCPWQKQKKKNPTTCASCLQILVLKGWFLLPHLRLSQSYGDASHSNEPQTKHVSLKAEVSCLIPCI